MVAFAHIPVLPEASLVGAISARSEAFKTVILNGRSTSILLKNPVFGRRGYASAAAVSEAKPGGSASPGEDRRREGYDLRQFPQILGSGGQ